MYIVPEVAQCAPGIEKQLVHIEPLMEQYAPAASELWLRRDGTILGGIYNRYVYGVSGYL